MFDLFKSMQKVRAPHPVDLKRFPSRSKKELRVIDKNPYNDTDKDKLMNWFDCKPLDKKKQGFQHQYSYTSVASKKIKTVKMPPELFLKTTYGEVRRKTKNKEEAEEEVGPFNRYKDNLLVGANGIIHQEKYRTYDKGGEVVAYRKRKKEVGIRKRIEGKDEYGKHVPVPFLQFDERGKQYGHEGRHTALVAQRMGLKYIPVTIEKPKDTKLTSKYERLEPIKNKQYSDWEYKKDGPVIEINRLKERKDFGEAENVRRGMKRFKKVTKIRKESYRAYDGITNPEEQKKVILYHGTSKEAAEKILKEGFKQPQTNYTISKEGYVYLTADKGEAARYARDRNDNTILKVELGKDEIKKLERDRYGQHMIKIEDVKGNVKLADEKTLIKAKYKEPLMSILPEYNQEQPQVLKSLPEKIRKLEPFEPATYSIKVYENGNTYSIPVEDKNNAVKKYNEMISKGIKAEIVGTPYYRNPNREEIRKRMLRNIEARLARQKKEADFKPYYKDKPKRIFNILPVEQSEDTAMRIVQNEDENKATQELNRARDMKREEEENKKYEKLEKRQARKERMEAMKLKKQEMREKKKERREEAREAKESWSSMDDYEKFRVAKKMISDDTLPDYQQDRIAAEVVKSFNKQASE